MKLDTVQAICREYHVVFAVGIGWLKPDAGTGIFARIESEVVLSDIMRRAAQLRNEAAAELLELGYDDPKSLTPPKVLDALPPHVQKLVKSWAFWEALTNSGTVSDGLGALKGLVNDSKAWDADAMLLGTPRGVLDMKTGKMLSVEEAVEHRLTKHTRVNPAASLTPEFLEVLEAIPAEQREYVRWHMARGLVSEIARGVFVNVGTGANGKSMVLGCLYGALGDYAAHIDAAGLTGSNSQYFLAELRGARFAYAEELDVEASIKSTLWKLIAATPFVMGRVIYEKPRAFPATWSVQIGTNYEPTVDTGDGGVSRRGRIIPWPFRYCADPTESHERAITVPEVGAWVNLPANQEMILKWLLDVVNDPEPSVPACLVGARQDWHDDNDLVGQFIADRCQRTGESSVRSIRVGDAYAAWRKDKGYAPMGERVRLKLINSWVLQQKGLGRTRKSDGWYYQGFELKNGYQQNAFSQ